MNVGTLLSEASPLPLDLQNFSLAGVAAILLFWVLKTLGEKLDIMMKNQVEGKELLANLKSEISLLKDTLRSLEDEVRRK